MEGSGPVHDHTLASKKDVSTLIHRQLSRPQAVVLEGRALNKDAGGTAISVYNSGQLGNITRDKDVGSFDI